MSNAAAAAAAAVAWCNPCGTRSPYSSLSCTPQGGDGDDDPLYRVIAISHFCEGYI